MPASQEPATEETRRMLELVTEAEETEDSVTQGEETEEETGETDLEEENIEDGSHNEPPDRASENVAVSRCIRAWNRGYTEKLAELRQGEDNDPATDQGKACFLRELPPLAGFENVRDFIACITYGETVNILRHWEVGNFLESAKVALSVIRQEAGHHAHEPKRLGRPPKVSPAGGK